jgi:hypothetical protein
LSQNLDLNIQLTSLRPSRLTLSTNAHLATDDQIAYFWLDREKKESFLRAVSWALLNIDVDHRINPDGDTLQSISVAKTIYFDGLTMNKFFWFYFATKKSICSARADLL